MSRQRMTVRYWNGKDHTLETDDGAGNYVQGSS